MISDKILHVENVTKTYRSGTDTLSILHDFDMGMERGELVAITGPSGIGKTTLLNIIGTLDRPDGGRVLIKAQDPLKLTDTELSAFRAQHLGFVFQFHYLLPEFTALENVLIPGRILGLSSTELNARGRELLDAVGVSQREHHKPSSLSGGERQRVAIARALMNRPALVLADEPTGNLDPDNGERLVDLIKQLRDKFSQSFLIATHSRQLAAACDRKVELHPAS